MLAFALAIVFAAAPSASQKLMLEQVARVELPSTVVQAPGDDDRLFVASRNHGVYIVQGGVTLSTPFLDLEAETAAVGGLHGFGLLSMVFHPDYQVNGRFYVTYMDTLMDGYIAEYTVSAADSNVADTSTRVDILGPYPKAYDNHGLNHLWFGPDGMLYLNIGDDEPTATSELNHSQDLSNLHGKIVRLDVDAPPRFIPSDNPFVGTQGVDERIFAYGLRQPWRSTYDPVSDYFFVGDVGHHDSEEISAVPFSGLAGSNFGWRCFEGSICTNLLAGCPLGCDDPNRIEPIYEYAHTDGLCAIIGGPVYRGAAFPDLYGKYFFADFCSRRVWSLRRKGMSTTDQVEHTDDLLTADGDPIGISCSFATDNAGEIYICDLQYNAVWKIVPETMVSNYCETSPNSVGPGARISSRGTNSLSAADLTLVATGLPPRAFGIFYYGRAAENYPAGNGVGCVGADGLFFFRFDPPDAANADGEAYRPIDFSSPPAGGGAGHLSAGSTWYFQHWYRDAAGGGALYNFSDGLRVTFCP